MSGGRITAKLIRQYVAHGATEGGSGTLYIPASGPALP